MTNTLQFGNKSWQEDVVDTERSHFLLTYVPSDNSSSIIAALVGCWNDEKRYFPFQLVTDDPEAIAHAVDVTNKAFNKFLNFDTSKEPHKAWCYFQRKTQCNEYFIDNVSWKYIGNKSELFTKEIDQFIKGINEKSVDNNWHKVDRIDDNLEHFKLFYRTVNNENKVNKDRYELVAKVGYWDWMIEAFPVMFLAEEKEAVNAVIQDLDYYLTMLPKQRNEQADSDFAHIWLYQKHHCGSAATLYSKVLWRYC